MILMKRTGVKINKRVNFTIRNSHKTVNGDVFSNVAAHAALMTQLRLKIGRKNLKKFCHTTFLTYSNETKKWVDVFVLSSICFLFYFLRHLATHHLSSETSASRLAP